MEHMNFLNAFESDKNKKGKGSTVATRSNCTQYSPYIIHRSTNGHASLFS